MHRSITATLALLATCGLIGCTSYKVAFTGYPQQTDFDNPIDYAEAFIHDDNPVVVPLMGPNYIFWHETLEAPKDQYTVESQNSITYEKCWRSQFFNFNQQSNGKFRFIRDGLKDMCQRMGGQIDNQTGWCGKNYEPLFKAKVTPSSYNGTSNGMCANIVVPKNGRTTSDPAWISLAEKSGFVSRSVEAKQKAVAEKVRKEREQEAARLAKQREEQQQRLQQEVARRMQELRQAELERQKRETPRILKTRGLQICKKASLERTFPMYVGYVEESSGNRIKILVRERLNSSQYADANYRQETIWDKADNWFICE